MKKLQKKPFAWPPLEEAQPPRRFPSQFGDDYTPSSYEWIELVKNPLPCEPGFITPKAGFRCRLDRVIFKDRRTGKKFITEDARFQVPVSKRPEALRI
jgi:hypothetical protein